MALTVQLMFDGTTVSAKMRQTTGEVVREFQTIEAQLKETERTSRQASQGVVQSLNGMSAAARDAVQVTKSILPAWISVSGAYRDAVGSINAAIEANTSLSLSLRSIQEGAQKAGVGLRPLTGVFRESAESIRDAAAANSAYAESLRSIASAASAAGAGLRPLTGVMRESMDSIRDAERANSSYAESMRSINAAALVAGVGLRPLTGVMRESMDSIREGARANSAYAESIRSIESAASAAGAGLRPLTGVMRESMDSIKEASKVSSAYAESLRSIAAAARAATIVRSPSILGGGAPLGAGAESVKSIRDAIGAGTEYTKAMTAIRAAEMEWAAAHKKAATDVKSSWREIATSVTAGLTAFTIVQKVIGLLKDLAKSFLDNAIAMDAARSSLGAVTGSTTIAANEMVLLNELADKTGVGIVKLAQQWSGLIAATKESAGRLEIARESFGNIIEVSARMGKSTEQVGFALYGFTQLAGGATVQLDELQKQIGDQLPGVMPRFAKELGLATKGVAMTTDELRKMVSAGKLLVDDALGPLNTAIKSLAQGDGPIANARAEFGRLSNAWTNLMDEFAQLGVLALVIAGVKDLTANLLALRDALQKVRGYFFGLGEMETVVKAMKDIQVEIDKTKKLLKSTEETPKTFVDPVLDAFDKLIGMEGHREKSIEKMKQQLKDLVAAQDALKKSREGLVEQGTPAESEEEKKRKQRLKDLGDLKKGVDELKESYKKLDLELSALRGGDKEELEKIGLTRDDPNFERQRAGREREIAKKQAELRDKLNGIDRQALIAAAKDESSMAKDRAEAQANLDEATSNAKIARLEQSSQKELDLLSQRTEEEIAQEGISAERVKAIQQRAALERLQIQGNTDEELRKLRQKALEEQLKDTQAKNAAAVSGAQKVFATTPIDEGSQAERDKVIAAARSADQVAYQVYLAGLAKLDQDYQKGVTSRQQAQTQIFADQLKDALALKKKAQEDAEKLTLDAEKSEVRAAESQLSRLKSDLSVGLATRQEVNAAAETLAAKARKEEEDAIRVAFTTTIDDLHKRQAALEEHIAITQAEKQKAAEQDIARYDAVLRADQAALDELGQAVVAAARKRDADLSVVENKEVERINTLQKEQLEAVVQFASDIQDVMTDGVFAFFEKGFDGISDLWKSMLNQMKHWLAQFVAWLATQVIVVPILASVFGVNAGQLGSLTGGLGGLGRLLGLISGVSGSGGGGGGGGGGTLGGILQILGLGKLGLELNNLLGPQGMVSGAFHVLTDTLMGVPQYVADFVNALKFGTDVATESAINLSAAMDAGIPGVPLPGAGATGAGAVTAGQVLGIAGGFAALGTAIYGALNASNNAAKAAYAASAAASAFAAGIGVYGALMGAAVVTAGGTGWTGIGLAVAAALAVAAVVLDKVIKPEGPTLVVGAPRGLNVATSDGKLQIQGDAGSRIFRKDDVDPGVARGVQAQMEAGITSAVISVIDMINAIALKPEALLGPTQDALQRTLNSIQSLNSSSAKNMENDIIEQLRFINVQVVAGMLEPVNLAFDQLRDLGTLDEQLSRLPGTVAGMVDIFKNLQQELSNIGGGKNTDVLRQLSGVKNQVENFGNRISGTAGQIAESIVTGIIDSMNESVGDLSSESLQATDDAIKDFDKSLSEQITNFSTLMNTSLRGIAVLRYTKDTLEKAGLGGGAVGSQIDRLTQATAEVAGRISTQIVNDILDIFKTQVDTNLAGQITQFSELMGSSMRALGFLRGAKAAIEQQGISGAPIGEQIDRLVKATGEVATQISTQLVSTALAGLSADLNQVLIQPMRVQATTVSTLFNDSLAALNALWTEWHALADAGIDVSGVKDQFERLLGGAIESALTVINQAWTGQSFGEFLGVLTSIPDELAKMNPELARLKQVGVAFAQVVNPITQAYTETEDSLRTTAERITFTETRMSELRDAIADAGNAADQALPLYAQLATEIQANAEAQIASVNEVADAQIKAADEAADAQIKAVNEMADATKKAVNEWADAWTTAINDAADTQIVLVNAWADDWTKAVNDAIDQQRTLLALWVEDMTNAVNTWADLANTTAGQLRTVNDILLAEKSPAAQKAELLAQEGRLAAVVAGGGPGSSEAMTELVRVEQQLLALAKQSDDLKAQRDTLVKLEAMQKYLRDQLVALTGQSDPILAQIAIANTQKDHLKAIDDFNKKYGQYLTEVQAVYLELIADEQKLQIAAINVARDNQVKAVAVSRDFMLQAIDQLATAEITTMNLVRDAQIKAINDARDEMVKAIKVDVINQLKALEAALKTLFAGQDVVNGTLHVPVPVRLSQQGGVIGFASGGMVPAMLEPGEQVFTPPLGHGQQRALSSMNTEFPRFSGGGFTVPGRGSGDTVPMLLPVGSFVLNRNAAGAMGFQNGGSVQGDSSHNGTSSMSSPPTVNIHIAKLEVRNDADIRAIIDGITRQLRREWRSPNDSGPFR